MYDLVLLYLKPVKNALSIFPSVDLRLYVIIELFIVSSFYRLGFRTIRATDRFASDVFGSLGNVRRMQSRIVWLNYSAMVAFTLYLMAFLLSRVKLCQAPAADDDRLFNPSECTKLTVWFQPSHLLLARAMLEIVTIGLSTFWVFYKHFESWSTFRLVMIMSVLIVIQIMESGSVLYYDSQNYPKSNLLFVTSTCAFISFIIAVVLNHTKLEIWQKAWSQPIIFRHPNWHPTDAVQLEDAKYQQSWGGIILACHSLYHLYIQVATWDFTPFDPADPYSLLHNFMLVGLGSLLPWAYRNAFLKMVRDERLVDSSPSPESHPPFILVLTRKGRVVVCTAETRAELLLCERSHAQPLTDLEEIELMTGDFAQVPPSP